MVSEEIAVEGEEFQAFRCRACRRFLCYGTRPLRVYCDEWCAAEVYPASINEERDSMIELFSTRATVQELTKLFHIARQRVEQIVAARKY